MRRRHLLGLSVIAMFLVFSMVAFQESLTPYVNFAQARATDGSVQVRGVLSSERIAVSDNGKKISFVLRDESGEEAAVTYPGPKPEGLEQASGIVAVGRYRNGTFEAEKLLVKCPSKYQGSVNK